MCTLTKQRNELFVPDRMSLKSKPMQNRSIKNLKSANGRKTRSDVQEAGTTQDRYVLTFCLPEVAGTDLTVNFCMPIRRVGPLLQTDGQNKMN